MVVTYEKVGKVRVITLDRAEARNAVSHDVSAELEAHLDTFESDDSAWVAILAANGPVFSAGADLKSVSSGKGIETEKGGFAGLVRYPRTKPLIAAVDGAALAGGLEIVLACDLVVASSTARFGIPEVKRSLIAGAGGLFRLPASIARNVAMELALTGDPISAERAFARQTFYNSSKLGIQKLRCNNFPAVFFLREFFPIQMGIPVFEKFRENGNFYFFCKNCVRTDEKNL